MSILSGLHETAKGADAYSEPSYTLPPSLTYQSIASRLQNDYDKPIYVNDIVTTPKPVDIDFQNRKSADFAQLYNRASYLFYNCSIFSAVVIRIAQEALRNGLQERARFQCKCPVCGKEFDRATRKCDSCGYEGNMTLPDETQKKLLVNWEGGSLIDKVNKNGWDLLQLARCTTIMALVYNQPCILYKAEYFTEKETGRIIDEIPREFVPLDPSKCVMLYDDTGEPSFDKGFLVNDRKNVVDIDEEYLNDIIRYGVSQRYGKRYYPARWKVTATASGEGGEGDYYAESEIYHDTYGLTSLNYGYPIALLQEVNLKAWMALELRVCKYYSTGHPSGVFVINNISPESLSEVQRSIHTQLESDPYSIPVIGTPPASDKVTNTKWHPFAADPAESMIAVKHELLQRICSAFGMAGIFLGDTESMKGTGNESHQFAMIDRQLVSIRQFINRFLKWVTSKYKGYTDWEIVVVEPPDNQSLDDAKMVEQNLRNALLYQQAGFEIISQKDGVVQVSSTPRSYDPLASLFGASGQGSNPQMDNDIMFKTNLSKNAPIGDDMLKKATTKGESDIATEIGQCVLDILARRMKI